MNLSRHLRDFCGLYSAMAVATIPVVCLHVVLPSFQEVFSSFGASLPMLTTAWFRYYPAVVVFPLIIYSIWLCLPESATRNELIGRIAVGLCGVMIGLSVIVMYLPIFRLGSGG